MSNYAIVNGELKHYGVVGMKWGVRRGNVSRAYAKAAKKANKLEKKYIKTNMKAAKLEVKAAKALRKAGGFSLGYDTPRNQRAVRAQGKAAKITYKAAKIQKKHAKWVKEMSKTFANTSVKNIRQEDLDIGKKYVYMLMDE